MTITSLSDLQPRRLDYTICVRVSRMWEYRGANEKNEIRHLDLVLIDQGGNSIYAEAPPDAIPHVQPHLQEGKIVYMTKITIERAKPGYRSVEAPYMIKLNRRTEILEVNDQALDFPKYTYSLTPFEKLSEYTGKTERFLDVIGRIIEVSNVAMISTASGDLMMRRVIQLQDLKGNMIELSLSGKRTAEFDAETVFEVGQNHHVIAIFVGTLMKLYRDHYRFLSGTSACRWYINENDISEIKKFQRSLPAHAIPVQKLYLQGEDDTQQNFEHRTLLELKDIDHFTDKIIGYISKQYGICMVLPANFIFTTATPCKLHCFAKPTFRYIFSHIFYVQGKNYECTATITGLAQKQTWCYQACKVCNSRLKLVGKTYQCTNKDCSCTQFDWKYKIPFIASDDTYSLEFMFFEKKGTELIGKPAQTLQKQYDKFETPPEISGWIGHKFTFVVRILPNKSIVAADPTFEVTRIKENFGRQSIMPTSKTGNLIPGKTSSISITEKDNLSPLVPIMSKKSEDQALPSQIQLSGDIQYMELEPSGIWDDSNVSNKRNFEETADDNLEINEDDKDGNEQKMTKKLRSQGRAKH